MVEGKMTDQHVEKIVGSDVVRKLIEIMINALEQEELEVNAHVEGQTREEVKAEQHIRFL
ncbi:MAG: hypothetical protein IBV52_06570 [Candidatus Bathyarchaeota archaeon]